MTDNPESRHGPQDRLIAWLERTVGVAAAAMLFAMMTLTMIDVVGRYFFAAPVPAGYELIQFGMGALVFLILPIVTARNENICVELIPIKRGPRARRAMAVFSAIVSAAVLVGFGVELWARAETFRATAETSSNLRLPLAPFAYFMSVVWFVCAPIALVVGLAPGQAPRTVDPS